MSDYSEARLQKRIESSERIVASAIRCFGSRGYSNSSISEIAAGAGVTQGLIVQRFGKKEQLFIEAVAAVVNKYFEGFMGSMRAREWLLKIISDAKRLQQESPEGFLLMKMLFNSHDIPPFFEELKRKKFFSREINRELLRAQENGWLPKGDLCDILTAHITNVINQLDICARFNLPVPNDEMFLDLLNFRENGIWDKEENKLPRSKLFNETFSFESAKHRILVVEDSEINREILVELLQDSFEVLTAENGEIGISLLKEYRSSLSLVLLDVYMPVCDGFRFLELTQNDPYLASVPVIVSTGSERHEDEERCLRLGATDFITKPYNPETLCGRIMNVIRLRESISALAVLEFDELTGLYNTSAFCHHAAQILQESKESYDLSVIDVINFASINGLYGEKKGDEVLCFIADYLRAAMPYAMIARKDDSFYALCPASRRMSREDIHKHLVFMENLGPVPSIRFKIGTCLNVDNSTSISVLCDHAIMAMGTVRSDYYNHVAVYNEQLEKKSKDNQKKLLGFDRAVRNNEFLFWIQPKVDISTGAVIGGEALVRWIDNEGRFISPGEFIPLFEKEGLIRELDEYMFRKVCDYQKKRLKQGCKVIPISVNLSRGSLFSKGIAERYLVIAEEYELDLSLVPIEITETAAKSETEVAEICTSFTNAGFYLHIDDFGTGYSSLSMLVTMPFNAIKLDKSLTDNIGIAKGNIIISSVIKIAHEMGTEVVAEGVETRQQLEFLTQSGCDYIQGFYFSPPRKCEDFEKLLEEAQPFAVKM